MFIQHPEIETINNLIPVSFSDGEFMDIIFTIGRVAFREVGDGLTLSFDYDILSGEVPELFVKDFQDKIGDNIVKEIITKLENDQDIIYKGGEGGVYDTASEDEENSKDLVIEDLDDE